MQKINNAILIWLLEKRSRRIIFWALLVLIVIVAPMMMIMPDYSSFYLILISVIVTIVVVGLIALEVVCKPTLEEFSFLRKEIASIEKLLTTPEKANHAIARTKLVKFINDEHRQLFFSQYMCDYYYARLVRILYLMRDTLDENDHEQALEFSEQLTTIRKDIEDYIDKFSFSWLTPLFNEITEVRKSIHEKWLRPHESYFKERSQISTAKEYGESILYRYDKEIFGRDQVAMRLTESSKKGQNS